MTRFRPCIDLHSGQVKQIVGGTLFNTSANLKTNYVSEQPASYFASIYKEHALHGAHVIMLGPGNEEAAQEALEAWPGGLQIGGGITADNAKLWVKRGAEKVIVTSYLFPEARFSPDRLEAVLEALDSDTGKLVIDLSCRKKDGKWIVAMNKWQTPTDIEVNQGMTYDSSLIGDTDAYGYRNNQAARTTLLRVLDTCCRQRGPAKRN
ncbi:MAG: hypothetical protein LQ345_007497 [Seirophora villosa]|nr:MAG: hypothetical protein LQ345_007497 [Seirophora villosa]